LLGAIASPNPTASRTKTVAALLGGKLPPFDTIEAATALFGALLMGL